MLISLMIAGCGFKTNPRPAAATIPAEIGLVHANAFPDRIVLRWDVPQRNADGSSLQDLSGFKVYRSTEKMGEECEDCKTKKGVPINIDFHNPTNAVISQSEVAFTDRDVTIGNIYRYWIAAYNLHGREGHQSDYVTVELDDPPPAPEEVQATVEQKGVRIEWLAPGRLRGLKSYAVYRGISDKTEDMKAAGRTKWAETFFLDEAVEKGKTYYYSVRSVKMNRGISLESEPSPPFKVLVPERQVAPPENVRPTQARGGIRVEWDAVRLDSGETQYNVYRSQSGGMFERINPAPLSQSSFLDTNVGRQASYRYAVTSFPKGKPEHESSRSGSEAVSYNP